MKTKSIQYRQGMPCIYLCIIILLMVACNNDEPKPINPPAENGEAVELVAGISTANVAQRSADATPATRAGEALWHAGDAIGIYMYSTNTQTIVNTNANKRYITAAGGASATFAPGDPANTAYYPLEGEVDLTAYYPQSATVDADGMIPVDVSDQSSLPDLDLMTATLSKGHGNYDGKRAVSLQFSHRLAKISLTLKATGATAGLDLGAATVTLSGTPAKGVYNLYGTDFQSREAATDVSLANNGAGKVTAIVIPPAADATEDIVFTVRAGDEVFTATLPETYKLAAGREARITITLHHLDPTIEATITDWITGPEQNLDGLAVEVPKTPEGEPMLTTFTMWRTANEEDKRIYTYNTEDKTWEATPALFRSEELTPDETFEATVRLGGKDEVTGLWDDLTATGTLSDNTINLDFKHTNARLLINLDAGKDFPEASVSGATVEIPGYTNKTSAGGSHTIIVPAGYKIDAGTPLAYITVGALTYEAITAKGINCEAGVDTEVTIELQATTTGVHVSYTDWITFADPTIHEAFNIHIPSNGTNGSITGVTLWKNSEPGNKKTYTYTPSDGWTTGKPFLMENIAAGETFGATARIGEQDAVTGLWDDLTAMGTLSGSTINLDFKHDNAQMVLRLGAPSYAYTEDELKTAEVTLNSSFFGEVNPSTGDVHTILVKDGIELLPGNLLCIIKIDYLTYEVRVMSTIQFKADHSTNISVAIIPTEAGITINDIGPWDTGGTGTGNTYLKDAVSGFDVNKLPGDGTVKLTVDGNEPGYIYKYTKAGNRLESATPLYWEFLPKYASEGSTTLRQYAFKFTYTPDDSFDAGTPEKDVLEGTTTAKWGEIITFSGDNMLQHVNAGINVIIMPGTTYSEDPNWTNVRETAEVYLEGIASSQLVQKDVQPDGGIVFKQAIVAEKASLTDNDLIRIRYNKHDYTAKLRNISNIGNSINGNTQYYITLTFDKTKIGISVEIKLFERVDGDGKIEYE